ncbi:hypothetical protein H6P81_008309 [Aristolochia fimbriata]|uniref:FAD-binding PCMH-type domain-containing protein n=1 Tax=Aristolochia fimbriata TaxID=158543 RepID=A0AAV7F2M9_ARIFI|nr:hypothetical protein H6P81_008309 [Aristolochia fimbriata]
MERSFHHYFQYYSRLNNEYLLISISHLVFFFFFFFFSSFSFSFLLSSADQIPEFVSCLASNDVKNVTLFPSINQDSSASWAYYHLLNFSIQNPRFAAPTFAKPVSIVLPRTLDELSSTILCVRKQRPSWAIRIRSGGHSYEGLSYTADDNTPAFVILDLMNLNRVSVHVPSRTAWVEAGATLGEVYHAIARSGSGNSSLGFPAEMRCGNNIRVNGKQIDAVNEGRAWGEKYFLGNYDRLVRVKTLIDPNNAFCNPQSIPPLPWDEHSIE